MDALGIDYVVFGEGEIAVPKLFEAILGGDPPSDRRVSDRAPTADEIPPVRGPSAHHIYKMYRLCAKEDNPAFKALIRSLIVMLKGWVDFRRSAVLRRLEKRK